MAASAAPSSVVPWLRSAVPLSTSTGDAVSSREAALGASAGDDDLRVFGGRRLIGLRFRGGRFLGEGGEAAIASVVAMARATEYGNA